MSNASPLPMTELVRRAVLSMPMAQTLGLRFVRIAPGKVELEIPVLDSLCFRPGQLQATAIFAAADFAAVGAACTLLPHGWANATADAAIKFVAPAQGSHLLARGRVVKAGKAISVCAADVFSVENGTEILCATLLGSARNFSLME